MTHPYFDYCDDHDRRKLDLQTRQQPRRALILSVIAFHLRQTIARIAARRLPV
ncbi:hypothetical protein [Mameliella alba]|uniref:hypothetical protein n=1 Tax=Mameliella alba TaxID=561184 RepID=UPI0012FF7D27|nr:hypothetical protein [Mameliella alba]MBY6118577.1 hypothetical protein [Mameliella alba]